MDSGDPSRLKNRIKELEKENEQLKAFEEKFRAFYENAPLPYQSFDKDGCFIDVNPGWLKTLGYERDEVIGKYFADFLHEDWRLHFEKNFRQFKRRGYVNSEEYRMKHKKGHYIDVLFEGCAGYQPDGSFRQTYCVFKDITEQRKVEQELRNKEKESKEFFDAVFKSIQEGISVLDTDLNIRYVNTVMEGWFPNKMPIVGKKCYTTYHNCSKPCDPCPSLRSMKSRETEYNIVSVYPHKDSDLQWHEIYSYPIIDNDLDEVTGVVEFVRDITQRIKDREQLASQKERLAYIVEGTDAGTWEWNVQTGETIFNRRWAQFIGYDLEELSPTTIDTWMEHAHPEDLEKCKIALDRHFRGETNLYACEHRMKHKDGSWIWILDRGKVVSWTDDGKPLWMFGTHQNITNRKQIEIKQQESEEKYRRLFEEAPIGIFRTNSKGEPLMLNVTMAHILGFETPEEVIEYYNDLAAQLYVDPQKRKEFLQILRNQGWVENFEYKAKRKDGKHVWFSMTAKVSIKKDDNSFVIDGFTSDITDRKEAEYRLRKKTEDLETTEEELRASNEELQEVNQKLNEQKGELEIYKRMVESSKDMMAVVDADYKYISVNNEYVSYYQIKREEVIGSEAKKIIGEKYFTETVKPNLDKCLAGETVQFEMIREFTEFGKVHLDIIYYPLEIGGKIKGVVSAIRDITQRKRAEQSLEESEEKHRFLFENMTQGVVYHRSNGEIFYANPSAAQIHGLTIDQLYGKTSINPRWKTIHEDGSNFQGENHPAMVTLKTGRPVYSKKMGVYNPQKNDYNWININSIPKFKENQYQPYQAVVIFEDITEQEQIKEELKQAKEKAEESDRLKSAFLANMSHEIRTPMNGIMGFSQMLQVKDFPKEKRNKFLDIIHSRTKHLLNIINDLVDVSKIEANQLTIQHQVFCLNEVLKELYRVYNNALKVQEKTHIELKVHKALEDRNSYISTDSNRFRQIMDNLLSNAIKFTPEGSVEFGYELQSDDQLLFYVRDTGIGISNDQQEHIFERFRQADDSSTRSYEGAGLGLTISKNLVELLGGGMCVESEKGKGSCFYFTLPYKSQNKAKEEEPEKEKTDYNWQGKTLLIVEDDPTSLEYMKELIEPMGAKIIFKQTGQEGYQAFKYNNTDIDLILMDIRLPDTSGTEIIKKIRQTDENVKIIAQTAYAMGEDRDICLQAGADNYIAKPIEIIDFLRMINKYV